VAKEFPAIGGWTFRRRSARAGADRGLKLAAHTDIIGYVDADGRRAGGGAAIDPVFGAGRLRGGSRWLPGSVLLQAQPKFRQ